MSRPATDPERLRQVAGWLDLTDPFVAEYMKAYGEDQDLPSALRCVEGKKMQADLRRIADDYERMKGDLKDLMLRCGQEIVQHWHDQIRTIHDGTYVRSAKPVRRGQP